MKKIKIAVIVILGAVMLAALGYLSGYLYSYRLGAPEFPALAELSPSGDVALDAVLEAKITVELPLCQTIIEAKADPAGDGAAALPGEIAKVKYLWDQYRWQVTVPMRPVKPGLIGSGKLKIVLLQNDNQRKTVEIPIPTWRVKAQKVDPAGPLGLADELKAAPPARWPWFAAGLAVLLAGLIALWIWRNRRQKELIVITPPWEIALAEIESLRRQITNHEISMEEACGRLTDLTRDYLEERFHLAAAKQTTVEFLHELNAGNSPLSDQDKIYLREFLTVADLIKFAKMEPEERTLIDAAVKAENLVNTTKPAENLEAKA